MVYLYFFFFHLFHMYTADYRYVCSHITFMFCFWIVECTVFARVIFFHIYHKTSFFISITNNQGIASFTVTVDAPGLNSFSVANSKLAINVTGWREVTLPSSVTSVSDCHLYVNDALRLCDFKYYRTNYNFTNTSSITLHSDLVPGDYRPLVNVICASFNEVIVAGIITNGSLSVASSETGSKNINISATWHY